MLETFNQGLTKTRIDTCEEVIYSYLSRVSFSRLLLGGDTSLRVSWRKMFEGGQTCGVGSISKNTGGDAPYFSSCVLFRF